ncbi:MAG: Mu transposase C-terminal domain-containing protein [Victivallales bacterium]|nr:Mu transposase C-terminal domain-containing protein [Victivallales bacterium]
MGLALLDSWVAAPASGASPADAAAASEIEVEKVPAAVRRKARERLRWVELVNQVRRDCRIGARAAADIAAARHAHEFVILLTAGKNSRSALTYNNFRNWSAAVKVHPRNPLGALCDDYIRGEQPRRGDRRFWTYFFAMYLNQNKLPATVAYRQAAAKLRREDPLAVIPRRHQALYRLQQLDPGTVILGRDGEEVFKGRCLDYIRRDWDNIEPGEIIVCDSRTLDSRVKVWDETRQRWQAVRPNIAGMMDARSWRLVSYWITTAPVNNSMLIDTLALYCVATGGVPPAIAYMDNGSDYCARGFSTPLEIDGVGHSIFNELGVKMVNALPYNARAKTIERLFRDMMQQFDKMFSDYLGSRPGQRNQAADWYDNHAEDLPSEAEFGHIFHAWLKEYHATPKHGKMHRGKSPDEIWTARPHKAPLPADRLAMAFLKPEGVRTVGRGPAVSFNKITYYSDRLRWGQRVMIKSDRLNADHIYCYTTAGELIGEAMTRELVQAMALDDAGQRRAIAASMARQRRQLKSAYTLLDDLTAGGHRVSPIELFLAQPGAEMIKIGSRASIKGAAHTYNHYRLLDPSDEAEPLEFPDEPEAVVAAADPTVYDCRNERETAKRLEMDAMIEQALLAESPSVPSDDKIIIPDDF